MSDEIKVYSMDDCDWWAGADIESVKAAYRKAYDFPADEELDPCALSAEQMERLQYLGDDHHAEKTHSFQKQLEIMIANGEKFPCLFATTEY